MWLQQSSEEKNNRKRDKRVRGKIVKGFIRLCRISSFCLEAVGSKGSQWLIRWDQILESNECSNRETSEEVLAVIQERDDSLAQDRSEGGENQSDSEQILKV